MTRDEIAAKIDSLIENSRAALIMAEGLKREFEMAHECSEHWFKVGILVSAMNEVVSGLYSNIRDYTLNLYDIEQKPNT